MKLKFLLGIYVHLHLILASFCLRASASCGFARTLNEFFAYFFAALYQNDDRELLRNVIFFLFFLSSPSSGPNESEVDEKRISRPVFLDRSRNSSTRFSCENRETIVKVLGLSARLTSARLVIYCVGARELFVEAFSR